MGGSTDDLASCEGRVASERLEPIRVDRPRQGGIDDGHVGGAAFGEPTDEFKGHSEVEQGGKVAASLSAAANHDDEHEVIHDVQPTEWIAWTPFLIAIVVFGVYPQLMFDVMDPAVTTLVERVGAGIP